jgi:hypothetical protein
MESHSANIPASHVEAKTETKTITEWFALLAEPYRTQALKNLDPLCANTTKRNLQDALLGSCDWEGTTEGFDYWYSVHIKICNPIMHLPKNVPFENSDVHTMD